MKHLIDSIQEKLVINKHSKIKQSNKYYALLGVYEGFDYLMDEVGDSMVAGGHGEGPSICIVPYNILITLDKEFFEDKSITIFMIPEKYQDNIDKFEMDYENGIINLDDDCIEFNDDDLNEILKKFK